MTGHQHHLGCPCPWCVGGNGGGTSRALGHVTGTHPWEHRDADFCCPTACSKCGKSVYFVQYNGGKVIFDSLGPPWPKHGCFSDEPFAWELREELNKRAKISTPIFGVVIETETGLLGWSGRFTIRCSDGEIRTFDCTTDLNLSKLPGALVILGEDAKNNLPFTFVQRRIRKMIVWQVAEKDSWKMVAEYPYPERKEAEARFHELDAANPGKYVFLQAKRDQW